MSTILETRHRDAVADLTGQIDSKGVLEAQNVLDLLKLFSTVEIAHAINCEHRTNQQFIAGYVFEILQKWSDNYDSENFDERNRATCEISNSLINGNVDVLKRFGFNRSASAEGRGRISLPYI
tara:strand:- start:607 stop:975 length:369 start_codon:yes stop_codon:yes gene_type:complete